MRVEIDNPDGAREILEMFPLMQRRERQFKVLDWTVGAIVVFAIAVDVWAGGSVNALIAAVLGFTLCGHLTRALKRRESWRVLRESVEMLGMALSWTGDDTE